MAHFAAALARSGGAWSGWEPEIDGEADLDTLVEELAEGASSRGDAPDVLLLLVEENDEWFAILRWDTPGEGVPDPRVYLSDRRVLEGSELAGQLLTDALPAPVIGEDNDDESGRPEIEPAGDPALLADLGTDADRLVELTAEEGLLPADVLSAVAEAAGAAEVLDDVRGT